MVTCDMSLPQLSEKETIVSKNLGVATGRALVPTHTDSPTFILRCTQVKAYISPCICCYYTAIKVLGI